MTLRLIDLEAPLDDVEFPNGAKHVPVPFGPTEYQLWRDIQTETDAGKRGAMCMQIIAACYPKATADDIDSCTPKMLIAMAAHAGRKIDQIRDALKNVGRDEEEGTGGVAATPPKPTPTLPSSQKTNGNTSSRKSRARSAKTGGRSTTTTNPISSGSASTISKSPDVSTPFAVSSTTSTGPC